MQKKNFSSPDEVKNLPKTKIETINVGDSPLIQITYEPGWKWSENVKPVVKTESCQVRHILYALSGRLMVVMSNGDKVELAPNDIIKIAPGHDAWVVGDEAFVALDLAGLSKQ
jgi:mannose-6-phosphate isomerase-like protein (cupin superfamily)